MKDTADLTYKKTTELAVKQRKMTAEFKDVLQLVVSDVANSRKLFSSIKELDV